MLNQTTVDNTTSWMSHMQHGRYEQAWLFSDKVLHERAGKPCWHLPRHLQYIWDGSSPIGKRVLVRCYHGLGDTIQFIRYMPLLKRVAKEVIVWAQPELIGLLETAAGIDQLVPLHNGSPEVDYDIDVEVMELPHIFRTSVDTIPSNIPYLHVPPKKIDGAGLKVGLVWKAGDWDKRRAIPFSMLSPLGNVPGSELYILQAGAAEAGWQQGFGIHPGEFNLYDYARFIRALDLVITVDSMPAHLAGALGVPVWNLVHAAADWRWMLNRSDSPWYPTMRIFRQDEPGNWAGVIECVKKELLKLATETQSRLTALQGE